MVISANERVDESRIRIYVGGLGGSVSEDDLRKTFSSTQLGLVDSVEIVRSKGRSFAYLDFVPCSDNGLSKLFSKYNGCTWKGGKLRLEKAKEHYPTRLKREWAEDNAICSNSEVHNKDNTEPLESKSLMKNVDSEMIYLQLFFPRLKKIKPIPFKGTGKHKYSFQHIRAPALPIHFCDCEEHSIPSEPACQESFSYADKEGIGMNKEELDTMNSVLSKILARDGGSSFATYNVAEVSLKSDNLINSTDHLLVSDTGEDRGSDDDDLVINMVAGGSSTISFSDFVDINANTANKSSQASKKGPAMNVLTSNKKRKAPLQENVDRNGFYSVTSSERKNDLHQNTEKLKILPHFNTDKAGSDALQMDHNAKRITKPTWRHLNSNNATFHISDITQSIAHGADLPGKPDNNTGVSSVTMETKSIQISKAKEQNSADAVIDTQSIAHGADLQGTPDNNTRDRSVTMETKSVQISKAKEQNSADAVLDTQSIAHGADLQGTPDNNTRDSSVTMETKSIQISKAKEQNNADAVLDTSEIAANKTITHNSWVQKSSWMQLIGEPSNSSFCISQVLSGLNTGSQELPQKNFDELSRVNDEHQDSRMGVSNSQETISETMRNEDSPIINNSDYNTPHSKQHLSGFLGDQSHSVNLLQAGNIGNQVSTATVAKRNQLKLQQASKTAVRVDPCSFVRSAASMKEWKKAKEALSRSLKKRKIEEK